MGNSRPFSTHMKIYLPFSRQTHGDSAGDNMQTKWFNKPFVMKRASTSKHPFHISLLDRKSAWKMFLFFEESVDLPESHVPFKLTYTVIIDENICEIVV